MPISYLKVGAEGVLKRQLKEGTAAPTSTPITADHSILISGHTSGNKNDPLFFERDVTDYSYANGVPSENKIAAPTYDGRTKVSSANATSVTVTDKSTDGKIAVTLVGSGESGTTLEVWMTKAGETTPFYLVAEGLTDGAGSYEIDTADADLVRQHHDENRSQTFGEAAAIADQAAPTAVLAGTGAGNVDNGAHLVAIVCKRHDDTDQERTVAFEVIKYNRTTGEKLYFPNQKDSFETLVVGPRSPTF